MSTVILNDQELKAVRDVIAWATDRRSVDLAGVDDPSVTGLTLTRTNGSPLGTVGLDRSDDAGDGTFCLYIAA